MITNIFFYKGVLEASDNTYEKLDFGVGMYLVNYYRPNYKGSYAMTDDFWDYYYFELDSSEYNGTKALASFFIEYSYLFPIRVSKTQILRDWRFKLSIGGDIISIPERNPDIIGFDFYGGFGMNYKAISFIVGPQYGTYSYDNNFDTVKPAWWGDPGIYEGGEFYDTGNSVSVHTKGTSFGAFGKMDIELSKSVNLWLFFDILREIVFNEPKVLVDGDSSNLILPHFIENSGERIKLGNRVGLGLSIKTYP